MLQCTERISPLMRFQLSILNIGHGCVSGNIWIYQAWRAYVKEYRYVLFTLLALLFLETLDNANALRAALPKAQNYCNYECEPQINSGGLGLGNFDVLLS